MKKIKLTCDGASINTACAGVSNHIWSAVVVHGICSRGKAWLNALPEGHGRITVTTAKQSAQLDYLTADPLP